MRREPDRLTVPEKLLIAGTALSANTSRTFSAEDLIVHAWQMFPDTFGLAGYSDKYPDANRVLTNIMGTKGMRGKGWLKKVGEKQYRVTSKGLADAHELDGSSERPAAHARASQEDLRAELDRRTVSGLERILQTPAARKALGNEGEAISFYDACGFWDITARSNAATLIARLADTEMLLDRAAQAVRGDISDGLRLSRGTIKRDAVEKLKDLNVELQKTFQTELDVIRGRSDERLERKKRVS